MKSLKVVCFCAALDTQNLGVSALGYGVLHTLDSIPVVQSVVNFDYGKGSSVLDSIAGCSRIRIQRCGLYPTRRFYSPSSISRLNIEMKIGTSTTDAVRLVRSLDAILDISGGDSFSDIYGKNRFENVYATKELAIRNGIPLVLLPQTYGPFSNSDFMTKASLACRSSFACFSRDPVGYQRLQELLGDEYNPVRHISGVDMSFAMTPLEPSAEVMNSISKIREKAAGRPVVGLNISGLVYSTPDGGKSTYGFEADYRETIRILIERLVREKNAFVVLIPHVLGSSSHDSDPPALAQAVEGCTPETRPWVATIHTDKNPAMAKGLISLFDWFCGTRMHSTIAALSTATPVSTIIYSDKAEGVFRSMGMSEHVVDPRKNTCNEVVDQVLSSFDARDVSRSELLGVQKATSDRAKAQLSSVLNELASM